MLGHHRHASETPFNAIIGTLAKRHLMAFRWRADDGPLIVVLASTKKRQKKNVVKVGPPLTKLSGSAHEITQKKSRTLGYQITFTRFQHGE